MFESFHKIKKKRREKIEVSWLDSNLGSVMFPHIKTHHRGQTGATGGSCSLDCAKKKRKEGKQKMRRVTKKKKKKKKLSGV